MTAMRVSTVSFVVWTASTTAEYQPEFEPWHLAARNEVLSREQEQRPNLRQEAAQIEPVQPG
jgi:hypothetical protein